MAFQCPVCGKTHTDLPHMGMDKPDYWFSVPPAEKDARCKLTTDTCEIDTEHFFIRGVIEIPVHNYPSGFGFGVWVSQKRENFEIYVKNFESDQIGPFFGWLNSHLTYYEVETLQLKTMAHFRGKGLRPTILLDHTDHQLAIDQREGITLQKAWEIVHFYDPTI